MKYSQERIARITKMVQGKLSKKINFLDILKKFVTLPSKAQAEKIVQDSSKEDLDKALKYLPRLMQPNNKESFNFKSISKQILLLSSLVVLGSSEVKAWDTSPDKTTIMSKGLENIYTLTRKRSESKEKASARLETILSKLDAKEKSAVKSYLGKQKYDLEMISENDIKKDFKDNEAVFNYFSKIFEVKGLFNKNMEGVSEGLGIMSSSPSEYFTELVKDSLSNVEEDKTSPQ